MCLAIAPDKQANNGLVSRMWRSVASTPFRLLTFGACLHAAILVALLTRDLAADTAVNASAYAYALAFGVLALIGFGSLMTWLPKKYALSPVHYGRYNSLYLLMMIGLLLLEGGIVFGNFWITAGMLLLLPAWLLAVQSLWNLHIWIPRAAQHVSRLLIMLVSVNFMCLSLAVVGQLLSVHMLMNLASATSALLIWPAVAVAALVLVSLAPARARVISL